MNKMLRDLDERRASELEKDGISRHVRTLPPPKVLPWKGPALAIVGAIAGAAIVWLALTWRQESSLPPAQAVVVPKTLAVTPPSLLPTLPAVEQFRPPPAKTEPAQARREIPRPAPQGFEGQEPALKLDRSLVASKAENRQPESVRPVPPGDAGESSTASPRIEKQPRTPMMSEASDAEYRKGMNAIRRGSLSDANSALRAAIRIEPHHIAARQALLSLLVDQKQWDEALAVGAEGLSIDPKQAGWAMLVARLQVERGDMPAAIKTLDEHVQYAERNADYLGFHALLLEKGKHYPEAIERYRTALTLRPGEGRWWYGLGLALEASQRVPEAKEAFAQARASANLPADLAAAAEQKLKSP